MRGVRVKIGMRLKNTRKFLGLTQSQFSAGIVTESFYSRVENGRSNISMSKLIELLNYHQVSLYDFFEPAFEGDIEQQAILAFIDKDIVRLEAYQPINEKQETALSLMISILGAPVCSDSEDALADYLKNSDDSEKNIFAWCLLAHLCSLAELGTIVDQVILALPANTEDLSLRILVNTLITCLNRFYQAKMFDEARITSELIQVMPKRTVLVLEHLVAKYYLSLLNGQEKQAARIKQLLQENGYAQILSLNRKNGK